MSVSKIVVLGAGVVGLSTAVQIQETLGPHAAKVTIIADRFDKDTVSDGAAGSFRPTADLLPGIPRERLKQWCEDSFQFYTRLAHSKDASDAGVTLIPVYHFFIDSQIEKDPVYREVVFDYSTCSKNDLKIFPHTSGAHHAVKFTTLMVECRWFQPYLMKRFKSNGGQVIVGKVGNLRELAGHYDIAVNCTGLGSIELLGDTKLTPIRGQMIRVKAPWVKHCVYVDYDCWIIPGKETVTIGGTRQVGDVDMRIRSQDSNKIWAKACKYMPSLEGAKWEWEWVGLRPSREPLRLERETLVFGDKTLQVVHNYGHGGSGVALAWGTAKNACKLVTDILLSHTKL